MNSISLAQIIDSVKDLPTLPAIVMELLNSMDNDELDVHELAQKVSLDIALTAKTLRYANSAYYSTMIKVTTVQQAISLLGLSTVKQIVMTAALSGCFPENNCRGFSHKEFWRHSNAVAIVAKILARRLNFNTDVAFTAGLLHDIGALVLATSYTEAYETVLAHRQEHPETQYETEKSLIDIDHAAIGEALAIQWNFSEMMIKAISGHHQPEKPGLGFLATIIHVADGIAHALRVTTTPDLAPPEITGQSWESLGLDQASLDEVLTEATTEFEKLQDMVEV
ncbi:HDOD domain-containing protein [Undibacterium sp. CY18W]|uniref:HDOD domain-containing protein n=1 Tax=Undibacterium hunanense TaxID=2762292 RepID=A0ABR6ZV38_9BURK|nr:HDOD domain-containing protein [Undibacterium hunanense]MBC3919380.1 HDOD domain-containing protein [Undibacterium hunanense]